MAYIRFMIIAALLLAATIQQTLAEQRTDKVLLLGNVAGNQTLQIESAGQTRCDYSYTDRGRGDHIIATWKLDGAGVPVEYNGTGNDYMKAPIEERFAISNGTATWKNRSEQGQKPTNEPAFYVPANAP